MANLLLSPTVTEYLKKSVNICQNNKGISSGTFLWTTLYITDGHY